MHVDGAYSTIRSRNPELITYLHSPPLGYQRSSELDIDEPAHRRGHIVRSVLPMSLLRKIKSQLRRPN